MNRLPSSSKRRSRRLQKKLRLGEFGAPRVPLVVRVATDLGTQSRSTLLDAFRVQLAERRGLFFGGSLESGFLGRLDKASITEDDRFAVAGWFQRRPEVASVEIGSDEDAGLDDWPAATSER
jgi:uncharacterized protein YggL (DUF469 family)